MTSEVRDRTSGRDADSVIDAVGMEAHGNSVAEKLIKAVALLPDAAARKLMMTAGIDRLAALLGSIDAVAEVERSRSSASTAVRPTRCR